MTNNKEYSLKEIVADIHTNTKKYNLVFVNNISHDHTAIFPKDGADAWYTTLFLRSDITFNSYKFRESGVLYKSNIRSSVISDTLIHMTNNP